jgi:hypothetical protein
MTTDWSNIELDLIVADYFSMLRLELSDIAYNKAEHRRNLLPLLNTRSKGSVEFKHQNISAVLALLGQPFIKGYLPRFNYQRLLEDKVIDYLTANINIEELFKSFADKEINQNRVYKFDNLIVAPPKTEVVLEPIPAYNRNPIKINYLEKEQTNRKLGLSGEELVVTFERWNLIQLGKEKLAGQIRWISKEEGDGAGFDILSKNINGSDKFIEVKTTKLSKEAPFYFTRNELLFSSSHSNEYHLYRLFNFEKNAKMFVKQGSLESICHSIPMTYKGFFWEF